MDMSTSRNTAPRESVSDSELYKRMVAFGLGRARLLRAVAARRAVQAVLQGASVILLRSGNSLWTWQNRYNARRHMETLDAHLLDDIGLSRADILRTACKPFWKP